MVLVSIELVDVGLEVVVLSVLMEEAFTATGFLGYTGFGAMADAIAKRRKATHCTPNREAITSKSR